MRNINDFRLAKFLLTSTPIYTLYYKFLILIGCICMSYMYNYSSSFFKKFLHNHMQLGSQPLKASIILLKLHKFSTTEHGHFFLSKYSYQYICTYYMYICTCAKNVHHVHVCRCTFTFRKKQFNYHE